MRLGRVAVGGLVLAGLVLVACGGGSDRSPLAAGAFPSGGPAFPSGGPGGRRGGTSTAVEAALASVNDTPITRAYFEWGDLAELRPLARHDQKVWGLLGGVGGGALVELPINLESFTGVDLNAVSSGVTVGEGLNEATRLSGPAIHADRVTAALERHGARKQGRFLALGRAGSGTTDFRKGYGLLDRSIAGTGYVALGRTDRAAAAAAGGGKPLTDDPLYAAAGSCLGNALWAIVLPAVRLGDKRPGELLAFGGVAPGSAHGPPVEEVCLVDRSAALTAAQAVRLRRTLAPASPFPNPAAAGMFGAMPNRLTVPISRYVSSTGVQRSAVGGVYTDRATLTTPRNAAFLLLALESGAIGELYARSCTAEQIDPEFPPARLPALCRAIGLQPPHS